MEVHDIRLSVSGTPAVAASARRQFAAEIRDWGLPVDSDALHTAELIAGELLSNAVQYAGQGAIALSASCDGNAVRVEVSDNSHGQPRPRGSGENDEHGRGLFLIAALADRHGIEPTAAGKRCWAEVHLPAAASPHAPFQAPVPRRCL
ncbi:ATP-binding protein [Streptomyces sp. NPDC048638]|uniref:ATP-binding protein n=1 Tax=Streptomyces sp. NPDC048638 TaxID=3365580 RepID=UPI0037142F74